MASATRILEEPSMLLTPSSLRGASLHNPVLILAQHDASDAIGRVALRLDLVRHRPTPLAIPPFGNRDPEYVTLRRPGAACARAHRHCAVATLRVKETARGGRESVFAFGRGRWRSIPQVQ